MKAMKKIGKNKAPSFDGLMDIIFQKKYYLDIKIQGVKPDKEADNGSKKYHTDTVTWIIVQKLTEYLNFCIKEKTRLLYN